MNPPVLTRRAVLYARVSKLSEADRARGDAKSVDQQLAELRRLAQREGVEIVEEFDDKGISASRYAGGKARDGWQSTMTSIMSGAVDELWIWELSRATRDRPVWAALVGACMAKNVLINVNGRLHDPNDPDEAFMLDLQAILAVKESATTSKRIARDVAARAAQGLPHGKLPYGYVREYDPRTRALVRQVPDPETAPIVRELARRVLGGEALYRLAAEMNARGVPSPETVRKRRSDNTELTWAWRPDQVRDVVASPAAAGLRVHKAKGATVTTVVPAVWDAIISKADHQAIVDKFDDPGRKSWEDATAKYLLTGLARCGECGGEIRRIKNRGTPSYACVGRRHGHAKGDKRFCVSRKIEWVDTYVSDVMVERLSRPDLLDAFVVDDEDDIQRAQVELAACEAELTQLRAAKKAGKISLTSFLEFEPDLVAKIADAQRRSTPAAVPPLVAEISDEHAAAERWEALELEQKREVVRLLAAVRIMKLDGAVRGVRRFDPDSVVVDWHHKLPGDVNHTTL